MTTELHGLLVVDKPSGATSHDVVASARRLYGTRRVGHAGTLDPLATGVLVLLFGEATKLSEIATVAHKTYRTVISFGRSTHSHDADGNTTAEAPFAMSDLEPAALERALERERARTQQMPPAVSAIKLNGRRAHELTRRGEAPELSQRAVRVEALQLCARSDTTLSFELTVSKGYYVRAFARDLSASLGIPAHVSELRRLRSGHFSVEEACSWPASSAVPLVPFRSALPRLLPVLRLKDRGIQRARCGQLLERDDFFDDPEVTDDRLQTTTMWAWTDKDGLPIAIGRRDAGGYRVRRGFALGADELETAL
ncbi:MAG TPA: tRNA pseudouridine(55) synthase TruB [Polyangiaceae bacterium]|nr:tRNA pseudouridine(55) synthase TruB [Polyangiaceae bacterium]